MLLGASNPCNGGAVAAASKNPNATDFSIAAIMSRGSVSREPSERSLSKWYLSHFMFSTSRYIRNNGEKLIELHRRHANYHILKECPLVTFNERNNWWNTRISCSIDLFFLRYDKKKHPK